MDYNSRQSAINRARTRNGRSLLLRADIVTERKKKKIEINKKGALRIGGRLGSKFHVLALHEFKDGVQAIDRFFG